MIDQQPQHQIITDLTRKLNETHQELIRMNAENVRLNSIIQDLLAQQQRHTLTSIGAHHESALAVPGVRPTDLEAGNISNSNQTSSIIFAMPAHANSMQQQQSIEAQQRHKRAKRTLSLANSGISSGTSSNSSTFMQTAEDRFNDELELYDTGADGGPDDKMNRRRSRNRIAALKYRQRQNERQQELEQELNIIMDSNEKLEKEERDLQSQVGELKQLLIDGVTSDCTVLLDAQFDT